MTRRITANVYLSLDTLLLGRKTFPENGPRIPLRLTAATTFGSGIQSLTYSKEN